MAKNFMDTEKLRQEFTLIQLMGRLWPFVRPLRGWASLVLLSALVLALLGRALPFLFGYAVDHGIQAKDIRVLQSVALIYLGLELARSLLQFLNSDISARFGNRILYAIRHKVMDHVQRLPNQYFDRNPVGRTVTRVTNDIISLGDLVGYGLRDIFLNVIEMVSILVALSLISWPLMVCSVITIPALLWLTSGLSQRIRKFFKIAKKKISRINAFTAESLNGMQVLQLYNQTSGRRNKFSAMSRGYRNAHYGTIRMFALLWPLFNMSTYLSIIIALFVAGVFWEPLGLSLGELSAFVILLQGMFKPIRTILERYNHFQNSLASADRIFSLLDEDEEEHRGEKLPDRRLQGAIEFRSVDFRYAQDSDWVLKDFDLKVRPRESVALVGRTGSGKTSIISLIQKFYPFERGQILIDGFSLDKIDTYDLRSRIGVVQQDNFIFKGSLRSNISLNHPKVTEEKVQEAIRLSQCESLISKYQEGLEAQVEERGANLSVGERQLIAFARVLAFDPDILILDEATANIDSENEQRIQKAIHEVTKSRTSIIIAHRLSTITHCDRIVVLSQGEILEQGNHQQLLSRDGHYSQLFQRYQSGLGL